MTPFLNEGGQDHKQNFCNNLRFKQVSGDRLQSFRIYFKLQELIHGVFLKPSFAVYKKIK